MGRDRILIDEQIHNEIVYKDELYYQYSWFFETFSKPFQIACDEFFSQTFTLKLVSLSKNINVLFQGNDYFVTKIRLDKQYDVLFKCSEDAVKIILDKLFGSNPKFDLSKITELEAKVISSFTDYMYSSVSSLLNNTPVKNLKRKNFEMVHLTFFIKDKQSKEGAKIIVSLPQALLSPIKIQPLGAKFDVPDFKTSKIPVNIQIGTIKFHLKELKNLEKEDIVVFENSNINTMKLLYEDFERDFRITPNPALIIAINNGGKTMTQEKLLSQDLWDNIQVEMNAEFEKVKITLGELKSIEQGLVVDLSSVYNNKIYLKVENKTIAQGELVIINDRYGVKIDEVFASEKTLAEQNTQQPTEIIEESQIPEDVKQGSDEEFDYSDFELDEQDI